MFGCSGFSGYFHSNCAMCKYTRKCKSRVRTEIATCSYTSNLTEHKCSFNIIMSLKTIIKLPKNQELIYICTFEKQSHWLSWWRMENCKMNIEHLHSGINTTYFVLRLLRILHTIHFVTACRLWFQDKIENCQNNISFLSIISVHRASLCSNCVHCALCATFIGVHCSVFIFEFKRTLKYIHTQ